MFQLSGQVTQQYFRELVRSLTTTDDRVIVMSYSRKTLQQTGDGHFAPIGGYHPQRDLILVMDVARFKYPPHWVSVSTLWEAMNTSDSETGRVKIYYYLPYAGTIKYPPHWVPLSALPTLRQVVLQRNCVKQTGGWPFCSDWMFKCSKCTKSGQLSRNFTLRIPQIKLWETWGGRDLTHFGSQFVHVLVNWLTDLTHFGSQFVHVLVNWLTSFHPCPHVSLNNLLPWQWLTTASST